ncbi:MAG: hypothetical protein Q7S96_04365 [bacterium]|nr:hypothetical protein [bacterium]
MQEEPTKSHATEQARVTPDAPTEQHPRTIFEQARSVERAVPWEDTPEVRLRDALDILAPEIPQELRERTRDVALTGEHTDLDALKDLVGDGALARRIATLAEKSADRKTIGGSFVDTVLRVFEEHGFTENSFAVARALRWLGAQTGRTDLRVVYPASGGDASRMLDHIDRAPVASVDCVTTGGPQGADVKARAKGREARLIKKTLDVAIADGDLAAGSADAILLDTTGVSVTHEHAFRAVDHLLAPGGIIIATAVGYMSEPSTVRQVLTGLSADRYRLVGRSGSAYIIERIVPSTDQGNAADGNPNDRHE